MRLALIGNTCQINFSLMRYLRNLGVDAHLLLFSNEGNEDSNLYTNNIDGIGYAFGENPQYNPEWDTWEIDKWKKYIHKLPIPNGIEPIVGRPDKLKLRISCSKLASYFSEYDSFVGSGISPAIFSRIKKKLTIFYPYSTGIEWVGEAGTVKKLSKINLENPFRRYIKKKQLEGIRNAKVCISTSGADITEDVFKNNNIPFKRILVPLFYNLENTKKNLDDKLVLSLIEKTKSSEFKIFSHMRHFWIPNDKLYLDTDFETINKNNDWLILSFAKFIIKHPFSKALLLLVDWGKDAQISKKLCKELGIEKSVLWLPLLSRRQVTAIMAICDVCCGDFTVSKGVIWGAVAYETLANGKPLLQSFNFNNGEFQKLFGFPPPTMLDVKSENDVYEHLSKMYYDKDAMLELGKSGLEWFNNYHGKKLATKWVNLLKENM